MQDRRTCPLNRRQIRCRDGGVESGRTGADRPGQPKNEASGCATINDLHWGKGLSMGISRPRDEKAMKRTEIWFPAKRYGWGWGVPCTWQGWAVLITYVGLIVLASIIVRPDLHMKWWFACIIGLSLLLIVVCWWKGERPSWRWGDKKSE